MRHALIILFMILLAGCVTSRQAQMTSAHKYESNPKTLQIYLSAYGDGYQRGCQMITTDYSPPPDIIYTNSNLLLQAAGMDGFYDGRIAALSMVQSEMRALKKHTKK